MEMLLFGTLLSHARFFFLVCSLPFCIISIHINILTSKANISLTRLRGLQYYVGWSNILSEYAELILFGSILGWISVSLDDLRIFSYSF
jgi:hypothetical protein